MSAQVNSYRAGLNSNIQDYDNFNFSFVRFSLPDRGKSIELSEALDNWI